MKENYILTKKFFICLLMMMLTVTGFSQVCTGNGATVSLENVVVTANSVEYDVYISNTGSTTMLLAGLQGSIIYDVNLLPAGATGTLSIVTQPVAGGNFPSLNPISNTNHETITRQLRWVHTPTVLASGNTVNLPLNSPMLFARFRFTSSIPWGLGTYSLDFSTSTAPGYTKNLATVYCNGNTNSATFSNDTGEMQYVNRTFTVTALNTTAQQNSQTILLASPNPFGNSFNFELQSVSNESVSVKIYDIKGKLLEDKQLNPVDVSRYQFGSNFASGVYNLVVTQGDNKQNLKVIKR
jgi:hypothetical protein